MKQLQADLMKLLLAGISLTALYDILAVNKGKSALDLVQAASRGYGAILARGSGQKPPAGY